MKKNSTKYLDKKLLEIDKKIISQETNDMKLNEWLEIASKEILMGSQKDYPIQMIKKALYYGMRRVMASFDCISIFARILGIQQSSKKRSPYENKTTKKT